MTNYHKALILFVLKNAGITLEKWEARVIANNIIGDTLLKDKGLSQMIKKEITEGQFALHLEMKQLKMRMKKSKTPSEVVITQSASK